jgi:hypothetical protein
MSATRSLVLVGMATPGGSLNPEGSQPEGMASRVGVGVVILRFVVDVESPT